MKKSLCVLILLANTLFVFSQIILVHNGLRLGDEIIKQQVEYKDPGREGENVIWDFSKLKPINGEYSLSYKNPYVLNDSLYKMGKDLFKVKEVQAGTLVMGIEHNTMYYYKQSVNKLEILGHENPTTLLHYTIPMTIMIYPTEFGQSYKSQYESEGLYSRRIPFESKGNIEIKADAYGMIILPSGDTLSHVIRIKSVQTINETTKTKKPQNFNMVSETYKWYSKGYRYPIFESVKTYHIEDSLQAKAFKTSFFFPPQEHVYLDEDKENQAVLDSLWNAKHPVNNISESPATNTSDNFAYNYYPNPVESLLNIEYYLEIPTTVTISLFSVDGRIIKSIPMGRQEKGLHTYQIDCNNLPSSTYYILRIEAGNKAVSAKIIKK